MEKRNRAKKGAMAFAAYLALFFPTPVWSQTTTPTTTSSPSSGGLCSPGTDSTDQAGNSNSAKNTIDGVATNVSGIAGLDPASKTAITSAKTDYDKAHDSCKSGQSSAAMACLENCSSNISSALSALNTVAAAASGAATATGSCSDFSKIMDLANKALTAYSALCATMKGSCTSSCGSALKSIDKLKTAITGAKCLPGTTQAACNAAKQTQVTTLNTAITAEQNKTDTTSTAGKNDTCGQKYTQLLGSAAAGIAAMIAGMMQGNKCADETAATATTVDCTDASQAQTPACLCAANPRLAGCALASATSSDGGSSTMGSTTGNTTASTGGDPTLSGTGDGQLAGATNSDNTDSGLGGSAGVGSPLGDGGSLPGAPDAKAEAAGKSGLDTNVLAGAGGGSGGGGGWGSGWNGGSEDKYKDYLPGGKKDPGAAGAAFAKEVTGGGGKSNWEKVRDRYIDNKPTLLNTN